MSSFTTLIESPLLIAFQKDLNLDIAIALITIVVSYFCNNYTCYNFLGYFITSCIPIY